jgi:plasmid maintenance system antidote protein VapI
MNSKDLANIKEESRKIINDYLKKSGLSINALAVKSKVHPTQLYLYLDNKRGLTDTSLSKLGKYIENN